MTSLGELTMNVFEQVAKATREQILSRDDALCGAAVGAWAVIQAEQLVQDVTRNVPRRSLPVCQPGCAWCCRGVRVDVGAPEALFVAAAIREGVFGDAEPIGARVSDHATKVKGLGTREVSLLGLPCPLLDGNSGRCGIYAYRPIACRMLTSFNAKDCERACRPPELDDDRVYTHGPTTGTCAAIMQGLAAGIDKAGLDSRALEFTNALAIALSRDDAGSVWRSGGHIFEPAVIVTDKEDAETMQRTLDAVDDVGSRRFVPVQHGRPLTKNEAKRRRRELKRNRKP